MVKVKTYFQEANRMKNRLVLLVDGEKKMRSKKPRNTSRPWMLQHTGKAPRRGITGTTKKTT